MNVALSKSVVSVKESTFETCTNLTDVAIPVSVTNIGDYAFYQCSNLGNLSVSNGVISIGTLSFGDCTSLTSLVIPESVTNIGSNAFEGTGLTNVSILGNAEIQENAFYEAQLDSVHIAGGSIGEYAFELCTNLKTLTLGNGVTNIGAGAFIDDPISNLVIPGSVVAVGPGALQCYLTNLVIEDGVQNIGDYAFTQNPLTSLTIPGSVTSIGDQAFGLNSQLTNAIVGAGVTNVVTGAFSDCPNLTNVFFLGNAPALSGNQDGPVFSDDPNVTVYYMLGTTGWSNTFGWNNGEDGLTGAPTVLWNPVIETGDGSFGVSNNQFGFDVKGNLNIPLVVLVSTNLANPVWTPVQSMTVTNGDAYFSEPFQPNTPTRFYSLTFP
jgi:hypothetical protein